MSRLYIFPVFRFFFLFKSYPAAQHPKEVLKLQDTFDAVENSFFVCHLRMGVGGGQDVRRSEMERLLSVAAESS
jgi:hypothetical protein